ncbi:hypothetical protein AB0H83_41805 [Dactylosporangium sp. NPDC050688]|uniref:hypothetical protein n=1 Tax=Dactylosporangium sp. NPDC050688 TaxID=3157217 RepID=UPI0033E6249F
MNAAEIRPNEAAAALEQVRLHQEQVFITPPFPGWFWPGLGALNVAFTAAVETGHPAMVATGAVAFAAGLGAIIVVSIRKRPLQLRNDLLGARGGLAIGGFVAALVALGIGLAFALRAAGAPMPGTVANVAVAVAMALLGPLLGRRLQRIMSDTAAKALR